MSNLPLWHDDMFACYPPMIEQLKKLVSRGVVKIIKEADDINDLVGDNPTIKPLDGAIYVIFDNNTPTESNNEGKEQEEIIGFSLVYTVKKYSFRPNSTMPVGKVLSSIGKVMNGFAPVNEKGQAYTLSPFVQANPLPVQYKNGFGYFSKRYTTTIATCADDLF